MEGESAERWLEGFSFYTKISYREQKDVHFQEPAVSDRMPLFLFSLEMNYLVYW